MRCEGEAWLNHLIRCTSDLLAVFRIQRVDFGVRKIVHDFNERNALFPPCLEFLSSRPTHGVRPRRQLPRHAGLDAYIASLTQAWRVFSFSCGSAVRKSLASFEALSWPPGWLLGVANCLAIVVGGGAAPKPFLRSTLSAASDGSPAINWDRRVFSSSRSLGIVPKIPHLPQRDLSDARHKGRAGPTRDRFGRDISADANK